MDPLKTPACPGTRPWSQKGAGIFVSAADLPCEIQGHLEGLAAMLLGSRRLAFVLWLGWAATLAALLVVSTWLLASRHSGGVIIGVFWLWTGGAVAGMALGAAFWTNAFRPFLFLHACRRLGLSDHLARGLLCQQEMACARRKFSQAAA
jgi:hypothetical protein